MRRFVVVSVVVMTLVAVAAVVVVTAPANWIARWVASRSNGHVLLADARGTVWAGSAVLAFAGSGLGLDPALPSGRRSTSPRVEELALPGRVNWTLELSRGLAPVLQLTQDAVLLQPTEVRYVDGALRIAAGGANVPASLLRLVGAPLNTLDPDGRCELRWADLVSGAGGSWIGSGTLRVIGLALAVSPVRPLGDYRVAWTSEANGLSWTLATERGPLELRGTGRVGRAVEVHVTARAAADAPTAVAKRLDPLLDVVGRRSPGSEATFDLGSGAVR